MIGVGLVGVLLGFLAFRVAFLRRTGGKLLLLAVAYGLHLIASYVYYQRTLVHGSDASYYYDDPFGIYAEGFGLSTVFIIYVVQASKDLIGGSYFDYFLLFQWIGFVGIALLLRILDEFHTEVGLEMPWWCYAILFIPSLHFWSSAVGKDSPMILAMAAILWATMNMRRRLLVLILAFLLMLLIRPHIALVVGLALVGATIVGRGISIVARAGLIVVASAALIIAFYSVQTAFAIDVTSSESVDASYDRISRVLESDDAGNTAITGNFFARLLSLLFRPFFFDAGEAFALLASFESLIYIWMGLVFARRWRLLVKLFREVLFVRFAIMLALGMILFLTMSYFNVGLGLRQKWTMLFPSLLVAFGALKVLVMFRTGMAGARGEAGGAPPAGSGPAMILRREML